jgi:hypothetical protein
LSYGPQVDAKKQKKSSQGLAIPAANAVFRLFQHDICRRDRFSPANGTICDLLEMNGISV